MLLLCGDRAPIHRALVETWRARWPPLTHARIAIEFADAPEADVAALTEAASDELAFLSALSTGHILTSGSDSPSTLARYRAARSSSSGAVVNVFE